MAWFRVDDTLPMNTKALQCSLEAIGLWTLAGAWSSQQLTDGFIPKQMLQVLRSNASHAAELVASGLWHEHADGYVFHDWNDYQMTAEEVIERKTKRAEAGRLGGIKSGQTRRSKAEANASPLLEAKTKQNRTPSHPIPSHPYNTPETQTEQRFAQFWDQYPKKVSKDAAYKAWKKTIKDGYTNEYLISQAQAYARECGTENREKRFIKNCSTWFNSGAFKDDYTPVAPKLTYEQRKIVGLPKVKPDEWN